MQTHFKKKKKSSPCWQNKPFTSLLNIWESYFNQKPAVVSSLIEKENLKFSDLLFKPCMVLFGQGDDCNVRER